MAISRYSRDPIIKGGTIFRTATAFRMVRGAVKKGRVKSKGITVRGYGRLDSLAGQHYGDGRYWWVIAAGSGIGWGMQVPPGTYLRIPDIGQVIELLS